MAKRRGHGEGAIYQRESDGRWCASVDLGFVNGKRRRKVIYGETRKEVADKLKALHRDQAAGINIAPDQYTVEQFLNRWLDEVICHRRPRTQESYRGTVRLHIIPHVGAYKLQKLQPEHVQAMVNALSARGLGARSVEYAALVLSRGLNQAKRWGYISKNVVEGVEYPNVKQRKIQPADEQQARALLDAVKGQRLEALYWLTLFLGLRRGEVLGLLKENIDWKTNTITIDGSLQRVNGRLQRSDPKTETSRRMLPIPAALARMLREHLRRLEAEQAKIGESWQEHGFLFPSERGTPLEPRNLVRHFKLALVKAGLPKTTRFHDLRHWCASLLIAYEVHPKAIQEILGHANITTTLNTYGHLLPKVLATATERMGALAPDKETDEAE
jgi:integrase